jgi:hypothetical protein
MEFQWENNTQKCPHNCLCATLYFKACSIIGKRVQSPVFPQLDVFIESSPEHRNPLQFSKFKDDCN